ncbi:MAG: LCP family protein [Thermoleophilia bacterium]
MTTAVEESRPLQASRAAFRRLGLGPLALAVLSVLVPGLGQLLAGRRVRGLVMLGITVALAGIVLAAWAAGPLFVLELLLKPWFLLLMLAANFVVLCFRVYAGIDAWRLGRRGGSGNGRVATALAIGTVLVLGVVPHVAASYYDFRAYDLLVSPVFAEEEPEDVLSVEPAAPVAPPAAVEPAAPAAPPAPGEAPAVAPPAAPAEAPPAEDLGLLPAEPGDAPPADLGLLPAEPGDAPPSDLGSALDEAPQSAPAIVGEGHVAAGPLSQYAAKDWTTMLLIGGDAGYGRSGLRTDTMIVVALQKRTGKAVAFGIPRNMESVPIVTPKGKVLGRYPDILNALYQWANAHASYFPGGRDPGATALKSTLGSMLGLPIRYYALVDLAGFVELVDAVGGVDITPTERVQDKVSPPYAGEPWIPIDVFPGREYHFTGRQALAYARSRWATSDYNRMRRQRCLISAMAEQLDVATTIKAFPRIASVIKKSVRTDIPIARLTDIVRLIDGIDTSKSAAVSFAPPSFGTTPDVARIRGVVKEMIAKPAGQVRGEDGIDTLSLACS